MNLREAFRTALRALRINRMRSALTTLGIVIGISAVIVGVALGNGIQAFFDELVGPLATQITVSRSTGDVAGATRVRDLTDNDVDALRDRRRAPDISTVTPLVTGSTLLRYGTAEHRLTVIGTTDDYLAVTDRELSAGRFGSTGGRGAREIVLGPTPAREVFGDAPAAAVGKQVRLDRTTFLVVGVLTANSQQDDVAVMPMQTARTYLFGNDNTVNQIILKATGPDTVAAATEQATAVLDEEHHISEPSRRDFDVLSLQSLIEQRTQFLDALRAFIGAIAAISLLVGGIGVANIMLVSVTERTREIGLRKAVGASRGEIRRQFLIESSVLASAGGVVGVIFGILVCEVAAVVIPATMDTFPAPVVSPESVVLSFCISVGIGIVAGFYPANRAARMRVVEALRYE